MEKFQDFLAISIGENTVYDFVLAILVFFAVFLVCKILDRFAVIYLEKLAQNSRFKFSEAFFRTIENIPPFFYDVLALYIALQFLIINPKAEKILNGIFLILIAWQIIKLIQRVLRFLLRKFVYKQFKKTDEVRAEATFFTLNLFVGIAVWAVGLILVLSNLGFNINSLIASLGVTGIAVAFAANNILGDIFSSFSIYFDRPFQIGDFIGIGTDMGTVKKIGLKTTRLQTLQGEELIISNREITNVRVQNFKKMNQRRIILNFGVIASTPVEKLKQINPLVKAVFEGIPDVRLDRVHFVKFEGNSLNFEVVFFILSSDYRYYLDKQQEVLFAIKEIFEKEGYELTPPMNVVGFRK